MEGTNGTTKVFYSCNDRTLLVVGVQDSASNQGIGIDNLEYVQVIKIYIFFVFLNIYPK